MPCRDGGPWLNTSYNTNDEHIENIEAALCGVLSLLRDTNTETLQAMLNQPGDDNVGALLHHIDWHEAGVKRKWVEDWWIRHQEEDLARRARETKEREEAAKRRAAIAKLTREERELLGLRGKF